MVRQGSSPYGDLVLTARRPDARPLTVGRFLTAAVSPRTWAATGHVLLGEIAHFWLFGVTSGASVWLAFAVGVVVLLFVAPWIARSWAALDSIIGAVLLGRDQSEEIDVLEERVDSLEESRSWAIEI